MQNTAFILITKRKVYKTESMTKVTKSTSFLRTQHYTAVGNKAFVTVYITVLHKLLSMCIMTFMVVPQSGLNCLLSFIKEKIALI